MLNLRLVKNKLSTVLLLCLGAILPAIAQEPAETKSVSTPEMRRQFEGLYDAWREAMVKKDFVAWQKTTGSSRQMETRNRIVSQMMRYPDVLFSGPVAAPDIGKLLHSDVLVRGDTATSIYFGKADFGVSDPSQVADNFVVLSFVREYGVWKFDKLRVVKIADNSDILLQIRNRDHRFLEGPEFQPAKTPPVVPRPVNPPDFVAEVRIRAIGYRATVEINGQHRTTVANDDGRDLVNGGLKDGNNQIRIVTESVEVDAGTVKNLEIGVYAAAAPDKPARRVYHFRPQSPDQIPAEFSTKFAVQKGAN